MPAVTTAKLQELQSTCKNIRNICILAHVDHGKTTLSDSLLASNGIISSKLAGKVRYLDSREDEQERGITMESSGISLYFQVLKAIMQGDEQKTISTEYLVNLIDSPGHVDFTSEVSTASRLCDGALVLIDAIEGICTQTITVLRQAWSEKVRPILVLNKIDRLITEIQLTPMEAYQHLNKILEQANAIMATFLTGDQMAQEARKVEEEKRKHSENGNVEDVANQTYDWSMEELDDSDIYFDPAVGNVIFASAIDGWAFRVQQFATIYAKKLGFKESALRKCLWGDFYFDPKSKRVIQQKHLKGRNLKPMFVQFVLDNIWAVYQNVVVEPNRERTEKIVSSLNLKVLPRDMRSKDTRVLLTAIMTQWLPLATAILLTIIEQLPSPDVAQRIRLPKVLYPFAEGEVQPSSEAERAMFDCDQSETAPAIAYVSKMFAVPTEALPENRRKLLTAEELRDRGRLHRAALKAAAEGSATVDLSPSSEDAPLDAPASPESETSDMEKTEETLIGFARLYSGTLKVGQKLYVLGPKYKPQEPDKHCSEVTVKSLYMIMGRELEALPEVAAGNVFGIGGLEGHVLKNATLSTTKEISNLAGIATDSAPIVRVALEPEDLSEMDKLVKGLRLLNQADPCVEVMLQETGEHVIMGAGELHLERCLKDLRERFAKIAIHVSPPIVPFRESIVSADLSANKEKDGVSVPRGTVTVTIPSKYISLKVRAVPLPKNVIELLASHTTTIKSIVEQKIARRNAQKQNKDADMEEIKADNITGELAEERILSAADFQHMLRKEFEIAKSQGGPLATVWDGIVDQIWSFGPKRVGPNLLVNRIPGYVRKHFFDVDVEKSHKKPDGTEVSQVDDEVVDVTQQDERLGILDVDFNIHTAFQLSTLTGTLCAEPLLGVCYIVEDVIVNTDEMVGSSGEATDVRSKIGVIQGQVISSMREAYRQSFLEWSPRLYLAMYSCDIQASAEVLGKVYGVISKRRGRIVHEDLKDGTSFWQISSRMPVVESFGFSDEIRKRTSGAASPQLVFSGFEMLDQDPFWVPTSEEELEDLGEKADRENLAKKYMDSVRKRKGMFVEKKIVEHAEKQRTLKKN
ncbi:P-loop containing nucleoside triphosphate hydrolase protein [Umbelopsis sp. PMI_123]|nr:P-loop containing nucleoside triphosphate hydrolase protein [Umbelopsis sp. PMI_123]